ncbi:hypothetical protein ACFL6I_08345 [candidate division KSB1 bacterium]
MIRRGAVIALAVCALLTTAAQRLPAQQVKEVEKEFTVPVEQILEASIKGDIGELFVRSSREDYQGTVLSVYDPENFDFDYFYDEEYYELFVTLDKEDFFKSMDVKEDDANIEVFLPRNISTNLDIGIKAGVIELDLTDISLKNFELDSWAGQTIVKFGNPNKESMDFMKVDVNFGEMRLEKIGNARFESCNIDGGIGSLYADLSGDYTEGEHFVRIDMDIGEAEIDLPEDIGIRLSVSKPPLIGQLEMHNDLVKRGRYYYSRNFDDAPVKLILRIEMGIGVCTINQWD